MEEELMSAIQSFLWTRILSDPESKPLASDDTATAWEQRRRELLAIRDYKADWNGFGADAPDPRVADGAVTFLHILERRGEPPPNRVTLSPDGSILLEWLHGAHLQQAEISDSAEVDWMYVSPGKPTEFGSEPIVASPMRRDHRGDYDWEHPDQLVCPPEVGAVAPGFAY